MKRKRSSKGHIVVISFLIIAAASWFFLIGSQAFKDSAIMVFFKSDNILWIPFFLIFFMAGFVELGEAVSTLCEHFGYKDPWKIERIFIRTSFPVSLLIAMVVTLTPSQFEVLGTGISFATILFLLVPHDAMKILKDPFNVWLKLRREAEKKNDEP